MNNRYAVESLGTAHRADLQREAAQARLAVSARRGDATGGARTMSRLPRAVRGALVAMVLALVWAAPAAAAQPTRTVTHPLDGTIYSAQESGCGFAVAVGADPKARVTVTDFSDGTEVTEANTTRTLTNVLNGKTYLRINRTHDVEWFDPANGVIRGVQNGKFTWGFYPGDMGPYGLVQAPGLGLQFVGTAWYTWDPNSGAIKSFVFKGTIEDVCAALS